MRWQPLPLCKFIGMDYSVINNEVNQQFEIHEDGEMASLQYRFQKDSLALMKKTS
jgi:hypothetical protein